MVTSSGYLFGGGVGTEPRGPELHRAYEVVRGRHEQGSGAPG
ncbi:hypothetical protein ACFVUY_23565 [Kitasatospora sp. NPDC058063]